MPFLGSESEYLGSELVLVGLSSLFGGLITCIHFQCNFPGAHTGDNISFLLQKQKAKSLLGPECDPNP